MSETPKKKSFALGYSYVLHSLIMYTLYGAAASTGLNYLVPAYATANGLTTTTVMSYNTVGAFISCLFTLVLGKLIVKKGVRLVTTFSLLIAGALGILILNFTSGYVGWAVASIFTQGMTQGYCFGATNTLITNWYPKKKGFVLGITTCGIMVCGLTYIPLMAKMDLHGMVLLVGLSLVVMGILSWFWIRNNPEEVGLYPDNMEPTEEELRAREATKGLPAYKSTWTVARLARTKEAWLIMLFGGIGLLCTTGAAASSRFYWVEYIGSDAGYLAIVPLTSLCSIIGSLFTGALDTKFGPRASSLVYAVLGAVGFALPFFIWGSMSKSVFIILMCLASGMLGATSNLIPSLIGSCFGRRDFAEVFRICYTGSFFLRSLCYLFIGEGVAIAGGYRNIRLIFGIFMAICGILVFFVNDKRVIPAPTAADEAK